MTTFFQAISDSCHHSPVTKLIASQNEPHEKHSIVFCVLTSVMEEHAASVFGWRYKNAWCHNPETDNPKAAALLSIYLIYKLVYSTDPLLRIICE